MPQGEVGSYFRVSKTPKDVTRQKRVIEDTKNGISPPIVEPAKKRQAYLRFEHLALKTDQPSVTASELPAAHELNTVLSLQPTPVSKFSAKSRKSHSSKTTTCTPSRRRPSSKNGPLASSKDSQREHLQVHRLRSQSKTASTEVVSPEKADSSVAVQPAVSSQATLVSTKPVTTRAEKTARVRAAKAAVTAPNDLPEAVALAAHARFAHLVQLPTSRAAAQTEVDAEATAAHKEEVDSDEAVKSSLAEAAAADVATSVGREEAAPSPDLVLPHALRCLLEMFRGCDSVVSMLHNRTEVCSFDKVKPAVQQIVRRNFEEAHIGQFLTVYPMVYLLRYDKQLDKYTRRPTGGYVLVLAPNLRTDGTQMGCYSPSKGHLVFTGTRLIQRRTRFHRLLLNLTFQAHRDFLINQLHVSPGDLPDDSALRRWHPRFPLESAVPPVRPAPLPVCPSVQEQRITSARDAVRVFQARALFREAEVCQKVTDRLDLVRGASAGSPVTTAAVYPTIVIPSPSKEAACSPRKRLLPTTTGQTDNNNSGSCLPSRPAIALFTASVHVDERMEGKNSSSDQLDPIAASLKGVSQTLLAKVRAKEQERRLLTRLTENSGLSESRRAIFARLPGIVTQVWTVLRANNGRPLPMSTVATRVADAHHSSLSPDYACEHLKVLIELCPDWLETVNWAIPHLRLLAADRPIKQVIESLRGKMTAEGYRF